MYFIVAIKFHFTSHSDDSHKNWSWHFVINCAVSSNNTNNIWQISLFIFHLTHHIPSPLHIFLISCFCPRKKIGLTNIKCFIKISSQRKGKTACCCRCCCNICRGHADISIHFFFNLKHSWSLIKSSENISRINLVSFLLLEFEPFWKFVKKYTNWLSRFQ